MSKSYDVAVVGLGAMGSAALFHLARRGVKVLGLDQFEPPHSKGSSHGETRVIREAYFEHPVYVPLVQRAYELWSELESFGDERLFLQTGGIMIGDPESEIVQGTLKSAREHSLPHEVLSAEQIRQRIPGFAPEAHMAGVYETRAGIVFPEKCIAAHLAAARGHGAHLHVNTTVTRWVASPTAVELHTDRGSFTAAKVILTTGPFIKQYQASLGLEVERQVLLWFKARRAGLFEKLPIHLWEYAAGKFFYGFPDLGSGVKIAFHHGGILTDANDPRQLQEEDIASMRQTLARYMPEANGDFLRGTVCLYTNTRDGHFVIDRHPEHVNVVLGSPCSGHGFKFASAIGEVLADMALEQQPRVDMSFFGIANRASN